MGHSMDSLYQISTGTALTFKADKKYFSQFPLEVGDIVALVLEIEKANKSK